MVKKVNIENIFEGLQEQMRAKLSLSRKVVHHPTAKGDVSELEWIEMLGTYLPERYSVARAFVIDSEGNVSEQIDIVIFDRHYSPFIFKQNGASYIPAECVYAIIEVKQDISKKNIEYTAKKSASVRKLKRTNAKIIQAGKNIDKPKEPPRILSGVLALGGKVTDKTSKYISNLSEKETVNLGCTLQGGFFVIKDFEPWEKNTMPYKIKVVNNEKKSLILFFLSLVAELQKMGTVPAIDISKYLEKI